VVRTLIVVGDATSGGGRVITGSPATDIEGKPVARDGDRLSCGCSLIAGQQSLVFVDAGGGGADSGPAAHAVHALDGLGAVIVSVPGVFDPCDDTQVERVHRLERDLACRDLLPVTDPHFKG